MAFGSFINIAQIQTAYQIKYERQPTVIQPQSYQPSATFSQNFSKLATLIDVFASEEMRKNAVIFPMLAEVYPHYAAKLVLWSEEYIAVPDDNRLNGYPDFLVSTRSPLGFTIMEKPLLIVVEAKEDNFTKGWGQCLAGMVACQRLNGRADLAIFGIVTNGQTWQFGILQADLFRQLDRSIDRLDAFGYLNSVFAVAAHEAEK